MSEIGKRFERSTIRKSRNLSAQPVRLKVWLGDSDFLVIAPKSPVTSLAGFCVGKKTFMADEVLSGLDTDCKQILLNFEQARAVEFYLDV